MSPELDKKLCEKYPKIFVNRYKSMMESCMHWGIECDDGWYDIIDSMCEAMTHTYSTGLWLDKASDNMEDYLDVKPPQVIADQVKEKFSSLRFYYHLEFEPTFRNLAYGENFNPEARAIAERYDNYIDGIVHYAEVLSSRTCELSGKPGILHSTGGSPNGWLKVLNEEVAKMNEFCVSRGYIPVRELETPKNESK
jgi:hypothetical protein